MDFPPYPNGGGKKIDEAFEKEDLRPLSKTVQPLPIQCAKIQVEAHTTFPPHGYGIVSRLWSSYQAVLQLV